jgi:hypothetical protein
VGEASRQSLVHSLRKGEPGGADLEVGVFPVRGEVVSQVQMPEMIQSLCEGREGGVPLEENQPLTQ